MFGRGGEAAAEGALCPAAGEDVPYPVVEEVDPALALQVVLIPVGPGALGVEPSAIQDQTGHRIIVPLAMGPPAGPAMTVRR